MYFEKNKNNQLAKDILDAANCRKVIALEFLTFLFSQENYIPFYNWAHKHKLELLEEREEFIKKHGSVTFKKGDANLS